MTGLSPTRLQFGPFEVDLATRELRRSGLKVKLSGQPFQILAVLLEHPGQLVTREELCKCIWSEDTFVDFSHSLNAAVNKLRDALGDSADAPLYIETLPRRGYRFMAHVEAVPAVALPPQTPAAPEVAPSAWEVPKVQEDWEQTVSFKRQTLVHLTSLLAVLFLLAVGAVHYWFSTPPSSEVPKAPEQAKELAKVREELEKLSQSPVATPRQMTLPEGVESSSAASPAKPVRTPGKPAAGDSEQPLLQRTGQPIELAEDYGSTGPSILRFDLARAGEPHAVRRIVEGRDTIAGPEPSPDGKKLVFTAGHNDSMELWICNANGSSPKQITSMGRTGTPRWSPDSRWIAFDSDGRFGRSGIYVVSVEGGPVRKVMEDESNNSVPSWSRDGKYIYFASNRGHAWSNEQLWKVPAEGGQPIQVTQGGGFSAYESMDGKTVYYARHRYEQPELWQVPVGGGEESRVSLLHPSTWASWALTEKGILLLSEYNGQGSELQYFDFATRSVHSLATLRNASFWLASSTNGSSVWYSELTDHQAKEVFKASLF